MKKKIRYKVNPKVGKVSKVLLNKYLFATTIFLIWIIFFDKNAFVTQWSLGRTIDKLEDEKEFLIRETEATRLLQQDIISNKEKYAREKYFMKKPDEQVFIVQ